VIWYRAGQDSLPTLILNFQAGLQSSPGLRTAADYLESLFLDPGFVARRGRPDPGQFLKNH